MPAVRNPFVDYLTRYTTASPDHEAAFDEFIAQAEPPAGGPLRLNTRVETFLRACFEANQGSNPPSVILTGNAGDGKTYLCRQIVAAFTGRPVEDWELFAEAPIERDGVRLHVVKDLSEMGEARGTEVLNGLAATLSNQHASECYLIAANEGRLRYLLGQEKRLNLLYQQVDRQLKDGPEVDSRQLIVINLTEVTTSSFVLETLRWMTDPAHWDNCHACPIAERCPLHLNAIRLRDAHVAGRVRMLYQLLEHLDIHVTVRDMLIHLAYTLAGNKRCDELQRLEARHEDLSHFAYYENIWGRADENAFRRKASVVQYLDRLHIGDHSLFEIDDFIVSGGQTPNQREEHKRLFEPTIDLNERSFAQDREAYLSGGADRTAAEEERDLMRWLPHCRRKLFFEWHAEQHVNRLIPFLYLDVYQSLLRDERGVHERVLRDLVLGLNRAFSRLYLTESEHLFVTTQYLHSGEQPRPLVRLRFPLTDMWLEAESLETPAFNRERRALRLVFAPPAQLRGARLSERAEPMLWSFGLLQFEYLLRLAHGGTYNVLAEECELDVRSLKDRLLSAFASAPKPGDQLEFFVAEPHRYSLKQLWIDENGTIRG
jgi:hypothetical protein